MTFGYVRQLPTLPPSAFTPERLQFITPRVLELTYTAYDLAGFAADLGYTGPPFTWNAERRFWLRAELDALYFMLYGIGRSDVAYIMDTFPIVRRKDEAAYGSYRTREAILSVYDELGALGLERLEEYVSKVDGGVAGGWILGQSTPQTLYISPLVTDLNARSAIAELYPQYPALGDSNFQEQLYRNRAARSAQNTHADWVSYVIEYMRD